MPPLCKKGEHIGFALSVRPSVTQILCTSYLKKYSTDNLYFWHDYTPPQEHATYCFWVTLTQYLACYSRSNSGKSLVCTISKEIFNRQSLFLPRLFTSTRASHLLFLDDLDLFFKVRHCLGYNLRIIWLSNIKLDMSLHHPRSGSLLCLDDLDLFFKLTHIV